ncbi:MAG: MBL fold metallo-hydrolase [Clostridia bacterium]|nr:MBL fold metallo-hydrolase [Clostridia bacterium]
MKLTMLGTGNALVTECFNTCFVIEENDKYFMVDGGGGNTVLHQLKCAGFDWMDMQHIFVTHKHVDHLLGIIWMVRMICHFMSHEEYKGDAYIYSHKEVLELIQNLSEKLLLKKETRFIGDRLHLVEVHDGETLKIIGHDITFFDIQSTKAKQYGFCMDMGNGQKLTCCGDEPYTDCEEKYAKNSKWLLHEAFCLYSQRDIFEPYEKHHSTVKDACELAEKLNVKNLLLYHTEDRTISERKKLYREEGSLYYTGNLYIPDDLEILTL